MSWRVADSLTVLKEQVNARWPDRSKASDGFIGDTAHAQTNSDHNPNAQGVVCAFDITHDPANGPDIADLFVSFRADPQPDVKYLIANGQIAFPHRSTAQDAYPYGGVDPHTNHIHVSVGVGSDGHSAPGTYDDTTPWSLPGPAAQGVLTMESDVQAAFAAIRSDVDGTKVDVDSAHVKLDQAIERLDKILAIVQKDTA